ncbi:protein FAR1-RELATED SEQUENCE 5-like [Silene latifolia]|uniref:protein FAR1-RELATED SEQUENCE 5-like n=1 Tax=Silene latifolia TaxID=37657 RepID=UPI003D78036D
MSETSSASLVPACTPQCIQVDDVHGGNHLSLIVTPGGSEEWIRNVATQFTPRIGQSFATLDECIQFYETFADACGFEPRKSSTKRFRGNGDIKTKLIVCNREGFRDSQPKVLPSNGEEEKRIKPYDPKKTKITRIGCKAKILFRFVIKEIDQVKVPLFVVDQFHAAHNHLLCPLKYKEFQNKSRHLNLHQKQTIIDNCKVNIGPTTTFRSYKEYVDGYQNVGACLTDFKNFGREVKCFIGQRDAQMFINQLEVLSETRPGFYYAYEVDENKCLVRVIWADAEARRNYSLYGEVVTFDPTYSTNRYDMKFCPFIGVDHHKKSVTFAASLVGRENDKNFNWVFQKFLDCMGGKEPNCLFTDQYPAMKVAVPAIFKTAAHRYCMWHIMQKLPENVGTTVTKETDFVSRMNSIVWDSDLEPFDFEEKWSALIKEFHLEDNGWLTYMFNKRQRWIPAYYRDIPLGCLLRTTQRSESMNSFFKRFENPRGTLVEFWLRFQSAMDQQRYTQKSLDRDSDLSLPVTKTMLHLEIHASTVYTHALFYEFQKQCVSSLNSCSAGDSSRDSTTRFLDVEDAILPTTYTVAFNPTTFDAKYSCKMFERKGYICKHIIWILSGKGVRKIPEQYLLSRWTKNTKKMPLYDVHGQLIGDFDSSDAFRQKFKPDPETMTKQQELEMLLGVKCSDEVHILPPVKSKNKGSGKRLTSKKQMSIEKAQKPKKFCNNCKQMAHHDKRNCPNPAAETSEHSGDDNESDTSSLADVD